MVHWRRRPSRPPIRYWFMVTETPQGGAPEAIRRGWVGVALPVREPRPVEGPETYVGRDLASREMRWIDDGVAVDPSDAIAALRLFERAEAADWWAAYVPTNPLLKSLVFRTGEGRLLPVDYALRLHPELADFDG